jgi:hypothetical protein
MSKDKGVKNIKKAPADKSKGKVLSSYKSESKSGQTPITIPTKSDDKSGKGGK